jgi:hypothetical protein
MFNHQEPNKIEMSVKKKQQIEYLPLGKLNIKKGHTLYEINLLTDEINEAQYEFLNANYDLRTGLSSSQSKLIINNGCIYIPALNKANALKKYNQSRVQSDYYVKEPPMKLH